MKPQTIFSQIIANNKRNTHNHIIGQRYSVYQPKLQISPKPLIVER